MQYYGIYARLLDFSEESLIALSFAVSIGIDDVKHNDSEDVLVWILKPVELNNLYLNELT